MTYRKRSLLPLFCKVTQKLPKISENIQRAKQWFAEAMKAHDYQGNYNYCYCTKSSHFKFKQIGKSLSHLSLINYDNSDNAVTSIAENRSKERFIERVLSNFPLKNFLRLTTILQR